MSKAHARIIKARKPQFVQQENLYPYSRENHTNMVGSPSIVWASGAAMIARTYIDKIRRGRADDHKKWTWDHMVEKYRFDPDEVIRDLIDELPTMQYDN